MTKHCPSCGDEHEREQMGHCNDCGEFVCISCQDEHFKEHCDPTPITQEEYDEFA